MSFNTNRFINQNAAMPRENDGPVTRQNGTAVNHTRPSSDSLWAHYSGGLPSIQGTNPLYVQDSSVTNRFRMEGNDRTAAAGTIDTTFPISSHNMGPAHVTMADTGNQGSQYMVPTNQRASTVTIQGTNRGSTSAHAFQVDSQFEDSQVETRKQSGRFTAPDDSIFVHAASNSSSQEGHRYQGPPDDSQGSFSTESFRHSTPADSFIVNGSGESNGALPRHSHPQNDRYEWRDSATCRLHPLFYTPFYQEDKDPWNDLGPEEQDLPFNNSLGNEYSAVISQQQQQQQQRSIQNAPTLLSSATSTPQKSKRGRSLKKSSKSLRSEETVVTCSKPQPNPNRPREKNLHLTLDLDFRSFNVVPPGWKGGCKCKNTKCLKLYCMCFLHGIGCMDTCHCASCQNTEKTFVEVQRARAHIKSKRPTAFEDKIEEITLTVSHDSGTKLHKRGCKCTKSNCLKKYCECVQGGVYCGSRCRCLNCQNVSLTSDDANKKGEQQLSTISQALSTPSTDTTPKRKRTPSLKAIRAGIASGDQYSPGTSLYLSTSHASNQTARTSPQAASAKPSKKSMSATTPGKSPKTKKHKAQSPTRLSGNKTMQAIDYLDAHGYSPPNRCSSDNGDGVFPISPTKIVKQERIVPRTHGRKKGSLQNVVVTPKTGRGKMVDFYFVLHYDEESSCITLIPLVVRGEFRSRNNRPKYVCDFLDTSSNWIINASSTAYEWVQSFEMINRKSFLSVEAWDNTT